MLSISPISSSLEGMPLLSESSSGTSQFEGPKEVVRLLEVSSTSVDFLHQVLQRSDSVLGQASFDEVVISEGDSLLVNLSVASLVDESLDGFSGRVSE